MEIRTYVTLIAFCVQKGEGRGDKSPSLHLNSKMKKKQEKTLDSLREGVVTQKKTPIREKIRFFYMHINRFRMV